VKQRERHLRPGGEWAALPVAPILFALSNQSNNDDTGYMSYKMPKKFVGRVWWGEVGVCILLSAMLVDAICS
jgi:hypothetical protein